MFGLILLTAVVFIVRGLIARPEAVFRLMQALETKVLLSRVQVKGVIRLGKMGKTIMR